MIFGKTNIEKRHLRMNALMEKIKLYQKGITMFAYFPVKLYDGRWVWLQQYEYTRSGRTLEGDSGPFIEWYAVHRYPVNNWG